jgi:hypothetical protein
MFENLVRPPVPSSFAIFFAVQGLWFAVITFAVVVYQAILMRRQTSMMQVQAEIIKSQDAVFSRRHRFELLIASHPSESGSRRTTVVTFKNVGSRSARDFYWTVWVPPESGRAEIELSSMVGEMSGRTMPWSQETVEGARYTKYEGYYELPLYPTRSVTVGHFRARFGGNGIPSASSPW